jgi:hypothetical protein
MTEIINQNLVLIICGIIIALIGIIIERTRAYFLIAGYNTTPEEKRKTVNIVKVAIALRNALILLGAIWIIIPVVSDLLGFGKIKFLLLIGLHFLVLILLIVIVNTGSKYKIKN